jgi:Zn-dependent protease with chaperone function
MFWSRLLLLMLILWLNLLPQAVLSKTRECQADLGVVRLSDDLQASVRALTEINHWN